MIIPGPSVVIMRVVVVVEDRCCLVVHRARMTSTLRKICDVDVPEILRGTSPDTARGSVELCPAAEDLEAVSDVLRANT